MKKIILFVALATLGMSLNSCSSDDSGSSKKSSIKVKIDGVSKTFNNVKIFADDTNPEQVTLVINATKGTDLTENISFTAMQGSVGNDGLWNLRFTKYNTTTYRADDFPSQITKNTKGSLIGTFSGIVESNSGGDPITLTEGSFDINY